MAAPYLAGSYTAAAGGVNIPFGCTIIPDSSGQETDNANWSALVAPIKFVKIFFTKGKGAGVDPTTPGPAPTTPNTTVIAANAISASVLFMYDPAYASNTDGTGQPSQSQLQTDLTNTLASLAALQAAGTAITGVGMVNEPENSGEQPGPPNWKPNPAQYIAIQQYDYSGLGPYYVFSGNHNASACTFTVTGDATGGQPYANGTPVQLQAPAGSTLPGGFSTSTTYYVVSAGSSTFQLSATSGGSAIGSSSASTGSPTVAFLGWPFTGSNTATHITATGSGFTTSYPVGTPVFVTGASLPTPLTANTTYYVVGGSGDNIQLSATSGGSAITLTSGGSGSITYQGLHDAGWSVCSVHDAAYGSGGHYITDYFPGASSAYPTRPATADYECADYYGGAYINQHNYLWGTNHWFTLAVANGMGVGIPECGNDSGNNHFTQAQITPYISSYGTPPADPGDPLNSMQGSLLKAKSQGTPVLGWCWYQNNTNPTGPNPILEPTDYRIPLLQNLNTSLSGLSATCGLTTSIASGDTIVVGALTTSGSVTGVSDTQGNPYTLLRSVTTEPGVTLYTFTCRNAAALTAGTDIVTATYSSGASVQAVIVAGDHRVIPSGTSAGGAGSSTSLSVTTPQLPAQPQHAVVFFASLSGGGAPALGGGLTSLGQVEAGTTAYLTAAYETLNAVTPATLSATMAHSAQWAEVVALDPAQGALGDVAGIVDSLQVVTPHTAQFADVAAITDYMAVAGLSFDVAAITDSFTATNQSALVQQVPGSNTFDYGISTTEIQTSSGSCLVVLAGWDLAVNGSGAAMPAAYVTDSAGNFWYHAATTTAQVAGSRCTAWICPNASPIEWLSVSLTTFASSVAYTVLEVAGMASLYSLDISAAAALFSGAGLTLTPGVTTSADFAFAVITTGAIPSPPRTPGTWNALSPVSAGAGNPNPVTIFPYYQAPGQGVSLDTTWSFPGQGFPLSGIVVAVRASVPPPIQNNANFPVLKVEAGFGVTPGSPSQAPPTDPAGWTDITSRVIAPASTAFIKAAQGRQYELAQPEAGTLEIWCDNHTGDFTPENEDSQYFPNVVVGTPVRVSAYWQGQWFAIAYGWVERWPQEWPDLPQWGISKMIATDAVSVMAAGSMLSALLSDQLMDGPFLLLPMNEQYLSFSNGINNPASLTNEGGILGSYVATSGQGLPAQNYSRVSQACGVYVDGNSAGTGSSGPAIAATGQTTNVLGTSDTGFGTSAITTAPSSPSAGPGVIYSDPGLLPVTGAGFTASVSWSVTFWVIIPAAVTSANLQPVIFTAWGAPSNYYTAPVFQVQVQNQTPSASLLITGYTGATATVGFTPSAAAQQVTIVFSGSTVLVYINGTLAATPAVTTLPWSAVAWGCPNYAYQSVPLVTGNFTIFGAAIYPYALPAQRVASQYTTGLFGQQNVDASKRMAQILSWAQLGLPRAGRYTWNGATDGVLQGPAYSLSGQTAADALNTVAANNMDMVAGWPNGAVVYTHKQGLFNQAPVVVFGDSPSPGSGQVPFQQATAFDYDNTYLFNVAEVTLANGPNSLFTVTSASFPSQAAYFTRPAQQLTTTTMSDLDPYTTANWMIAKYSQPSLRVSGLVVDVASNPQAAFGAVLGLLQGQVATVIRTPVGGAQIAQDVLVQKITQQIGASVWRSSFQLSPYDIESAVLQLDAPGFDVTGPPNALA